jgi:cytochrome b561
LLGQYLVYLFVALHASRAHCANAIFKRNGVFERMLPVRRTVQRARI